MFDKYWNETFQSFCLFFVTGYLMLFFPTEILAEAYINLQNISVKTIFHFSSKMILKLQLYFMFFYSIDILSFQEAHRIIHVECGLTAIGQRYIYLSTNFCSSRVYEKGVIAPHLAPTESNSFYGQLKFANSIAFVQRGQLILLEKTHSCSLAILWSRAITWSGLFPSALGYWISSFSCLCLSIISFTLTPFTLLRPTAGLSGQTVSAEVTLHPLLGGNRTQEGGLLAKCRASQGRGLQEAKRVFWN